MSILYRNINKFLEEKQKIIINKNNAIGAEKVEYLKDCFGQHFCSSELPVNKLKKGYFSLIRIYSDCFSAIMGLVMVLIP